MGFWEKITGKKEAPRPAQEAPKAPVEKTAEIAKLAEEKFKAANKAYNELARKKIKDGPFTKTWQQLNEAYNWMSAERKGAESRLKARLRDNIGAYTADQLMEKSAQEGTNFVAVGKRKMREMNMSWTARAEADESLYYSLSGNEKELDILRKNAGAADKQYEAYALGDIKMELKGGPQYQESAKRRFGDVSPGRMEERVEHKIKKAPSGEQTVEAFLREAKAPKY